MPNKKNLEKSIEKHERHKCNPKPKDFFGTTTYQCGCGLYFTKKQYKDYLEGKYRPRRNILLD